MSRTWIYVEQGDDGNAVERRITDEEIIAFYFPYWSAQMRKVGKPELINQENCIDDFVVVHWAALPGERADAPKDTP